MTSPAKVTNPHNASRPLTDFTTPENISSGAPNPTNIAVMKTAKAAVVMGGDVIPVFSY